MYSRIRNCLAASVLLATAATGQQAIDEPTTPSSRPSATEVSTLGPADRILLNEEDAQLAALLAEALERNPGLAGARARARAAEHHGTAAGALPDPTVGITAFLKSPETRTGPQVLTLNLLQELPWLSKLDLDEQASLLTAASLHAEVESNRLALITEVRRLYFELAFLSRQKEITNDFVDHLRQHEEISRSRYATGTGASGWARSIHLACRSTLDLPRPTDHALAFFVREPFPSRSSSTVVCRLKWRRNAVTGLPVSP